MIDKPKIREEICQICNKVLDEYDESEKLESVSVMNMADKTIFLGNFKIYNMDETTTIYNKIIDKLNNVGKLDIKKQRVTPCCSLQYTLVSFHITL